MIRVSVSDLDALRYWRNSEDMDLGAILRRLRKEEPPTEAMMAGSAFHAFLENAGELNAVNITQDGFRFHFAIDGAIALPPIRELKAEKVYMIDGEPMELVGVVDGMFGTLVEDHKLTARYDAENYTDALQWRCYLDMFDAESFRYNIFEARKNSDGVYVVRAFYPMTFFRYPDLQSDVTTALRDFLGFAKAHLPERFD